MTLWQWIRNLIHPHAHEPAPTPLPSPTPVPEPLSALFDAIGEVRADHHLPPLLPDAKLDAMAQSWADVMARDRLLTHGIPPRDFETRFKAVYPDSFGDEIITEGERTAEEAVNAWMNSPKHRAAILGDYLHVGCGRSGSYWCCDFLL